MANRPDVSGGLLAPLARDHQNTVWSKLEIRLGLGYGISQRGQFGFALPGRRPAGWCDPRRRSDSLADVLQDAAYRAAVRDKGDDLHVGLAGRAHQWRGLVKAGQQHGPEIAGG